MDVSDTPAVGLLSRGSTWMAGSPDAVRAREALNQDNALPCCARNAGADALGKQREAQLLSLHHLVL